MQFTVHSKATGRLVLVRLDDSIESAAKNARNSFTQCALNADDAVVAVADKTYASAELERFGEYWPEGSETHRNASWYPDESDAVPPRP